MTRDGTAQIDASFQPEYVGDWPNGVECGPYCATASEQIVVQIPE